MRVKFYVGDGKEDAFICGVNGNVTIGALEDMEINFRNGDLKIPDGISVVEVEPIHNREKQYNYADVMLFDWYDFEIKRTIKEVPDDNDSPAPPTS